MRVWLYNQYKWQIRPLIFKFLRFITRKKVKIKINGFKNETDFRFSSQESRLSISGDNNQVSIHPNTNIKSINIYINGDNNILKFDENVHIDNLSIYCEGNNCSFIISRGSYISSAVFILAESGTGIKIGKNCMFAGGIEIRTGDSHGIFDISSKVRINHGKNVVIGDYVWVANGATILKGANIPNGSIIGSKSLVCGKLDFENSIYVGIPAKAVKKNVAWAWELNRFPEHRF